MDIETIEKELALLREVIGGYESIPSKERTRPVRRGLSAARNLQTARSNHLKARKKADQVLAPHFRGSTAG